MSPNQPNPPLPNVALVPSPDEPADPLNAFVLAHRRGLPRTRGAKRFNAGEHVWIGGHGAERARLWLTEHRGLALRADLFTSIRRKGVADELHYGEIVALSGDFYETPEELFAETPARSQWLWPEHDAQRLREIFARELSWIEDRPASAPSPYPDYNVRLAWSAKSFIELALRNSDHFGWHNVLCYCRHHARALELAVQARGIESETFRQALYTNAFADHFLTDGFAAGHVRVPRAEIRAWAAQAGYSEKLAGALAKLLHDQDGHIDPRSLHGVDEGAQRPDSGLRVMDATGAEWYARCDGQLFLDRAASGSPAVERAVSAVAASVTELLLAWRRRELPPGVYGATRLVPFPHPQAPGLVQKFPADLAQAELEALCAGASWYEKVPWIGAGLRPEHVRALLLALPSLMAEFRAHVRADVAADPDTVSHIAPEYVSAYQELA